MIFQSILEQNKKAITAEITPPHGTNTEHFMMLARKFKGRVHAINVTDNQRALMRMSNLAAAALLEKEGCEAIYQLTCRDRNVLALQSDLLGAKGLGIKNVLALTGDPVSAGDTAEAKGVFQFESTGLLRLITKLNEGVDVNGKPLDGKLGLYPGAVVNPTGRGIDAQIRRMDKKIQSGAKFFQTQAIFSAEHLASFMDRVKPMNTKVLACVLIIRSLKTAKFLVDKVPGINVPDELVARLESAKDPSEEGLNIAAELTRDYLKLCDGVHLIAIRDEVKILDVLDRAGVTSL